LKGDGGVIGGGTFPVNNSWLANAHLGKEAQREANPAITAPFVSSHHCFGRGMEKPLMPEDKFPK